jgi:spore maturation protein CgeB
MRIDLLLADRRCYTYENYAAAHLRSHFQELGISCRSLYLGEGILNDYIASLDASAPDLTCSFSDLCFSDRAICDLLALPHLFWIEHSLAEAAAYLRSKYASIAISERAYAEKRLHFLPTPAAPTWRGSAKERPFSALFFGNLIDCDNLIATWRRLFGEEVSLTLQELIAICHQVPHLPPFFPIKKRLQSDPHLLKKISLHDLICAAETYLRAESAYGLISTFTACRLDIWGDHIGNNWLVRLKNRDQIFLHDPLPYTEHFELLKQSKIAIFDQPLWSDGDGHFLVQAVAMGCLPLTNPTPYLRELIQEEELFYPAQDWKNLEEKVRYFLAHPHKRQSLIEKMQEEIVPQKSWRSCAQEIERICKNWQS